MCLDFFDVLISIVNETEDYKGPSLTKLTKCLIRITERYLKLPYEAKNTLNFKYKITQYYLKAHEELKYLPEAQCTINFLFNF